jgi:hypothetical protein
MNRGNAQPAIFCVWNYEISDFRRAESKKLEKIKIKGSDEWKTRPRTKRRELTARTEARAVAANLKIFS